jgi:hypothetical protein
MIRGSVTHKFFSALRAPAILSISSLQTFHIGKRNKEIEQVAARAGESR